MASIGATQHQNQIEALVQQALALHQGGQIRAAESLYGQVLAVAPDHPDALHLLGLVRLQSGDLSAAVELIHKATTQRPENWAYQGNLAKALFQLGNYAEAIATYRRAAKLKPDEPQFAMGIANCHACRADHAEAEAQLRKLVQRYPRFALAWYNLGNTVRDQGRPEEAIEPYRRAIQLDPGLADAHVNLGNALRALNRLDEAERAFRDAFEAKPEYVLARCNLASHLIDGGRFAEAEEICRKLVNDEPTLAPAHLFLGAALRHQGRLLEALSCYRKASELDYSNAIASEACALVLGELGNYHEAFRYISKAHNLKGDSSSTHRILGPLLLAAGRLGDGWRSFLFRAAAEYLQEFPQLKLSRDLPPSLAGKFVCVLREQGLGDEVFFLRYVRELRRRGARISYSCSGKLLGILRGADFMHEVLDERAPLPDADVRIMLGDLAYALTASPCSPLPHENLYSKSRELPRFAQRISIYFPPPPPTISLVPDPVQVRVLVERLRAFGRPPYIGVTWRAGTPPAEQSGRVWILFKEIRLEHLARAVTPISGTLISIQRNPKEGEISALSRLAGRSVLDLSALNDDLGDMLALLALLDEYVGVSNTNMHLRAAAGKTARVLVPRPAEWRWMATGDESAWFPGFKIYRQTPDGSWIEAIERLRADLLTAFGNRK